MQRVAEARDAALTHPASRILREAAELVSNSSWDFHLHCHPEYDLSSVEAAGALLADTIAKMDTFELIAATSSLVRLESALQ